MDIKEIIEKMAKLGIEGLKKEEIETLNNLSQTQTIHHFLSNISIEDIEKKRETFYSLNFKKMNDEELFNAVMNTISFDINNSGTQQSILIPRSITYSKRTRFFKIRSLAVDDHFIPLKAMSKEQDAWNAPEELCEIGRINKKRESLLYTSPQNPNICVEEMGIKDDERFCLVVYESIKDIRTTVIGIWENSLDFTKEENLKLRMITNILKDLFTREIGKGTEYWYRVSERIAKDYYDLPREVQDGWCYPSIAAKLGYNVCFRPEVAKEVLRLVGVQICTVKRMNDNYMYSCQAIAVWNDNKQSFDYYPVNSPECNRLFPEIQLN